MKRSPTGDVGRQLGEQDYGPFLKVRKKGAKVIFRFKGKLTLAPYFLASTHQQKTWGSERFRLQIEALAQRDLQVRPRGRPRAAEKCT